MQKCFKCKPWFPDGHAIASERSIRLPEIDFPPLTMEPKPGALKLLRCARRAEGHPGGRAADPLLHVDNRPSGPPQGRVELPPRQVSWEVADPPDTLHGHRKRPSQILRAGESWGISAGREC